MKDILISTSMDGSIYAHSIGVPEEDASSDAAAGGGEEESIDEDIKVKQQQQQKSNNNVGKKLLLWSNNIGGAMVKSYQSKNAFNTGMIVPGNDGSIFLFFNGKLKKFPYSIVDFVERSPLYEKLPTGKSIAIVGDKFSTVFQLDPVTGSIVHSFDMSTNPGNNNNNQQQNNNNGETPGPDAGYITLGREDFRIRAFDLETKEEVWNFTYGKVRPLNGETVISNPLFGARNGNGNGAWKNNQLIRQGVLSSTTGSNVEANAVVEDIDDMSISIYFKDDNFIGENGVDAQNLGVLRAIELDEPNPDAGSSSSNIEWRFMSKPLNKKGGNTNFDSDFIVESVQVKEMILEDGQSQIYALVKPADTQLATYVPTPPTGKVQEGGNEVSVMLPELTDSEILQYFYGLDKRTYCSQDSPSEECSLEIGSIYQIVVQNQKLKAIGLPEKYENAPITPVNTHNPLFKTDLGFGLSKVNTNQSIMTVALLFFFLFLSLVRTLRNRYFNQLESKGGAVVNVSGSHVKVGKLDAFMDQVKGYGCNGTVVVEGRLDGRPVAVKRMLKNLYTDASKEIDLLIRSDGHQNVVRYFAKEETPDFVFIALELCEITLELGISRLHKQRHQFQKQLQDIESQQQEEADGLAPLKKKKQEKYVGLIKRPNDMTVQFLREICSATKHLHDHQIIHCDIKPQNILLVPRKGVQLTPDNPDYYNIGYQWVPKISDMGLGRSISEHQSSFTGYSSFNAHDGKNKGGNSAQGSNSKSSSSSNEGAGTIGWRAPELLQQRYKVMEKLDPEMNGDAKNDASNENSKQSSRLSRKVDIFSLGCVMYYILDEGKHPFGLPYEREARIMNHSPNLERISHLDEFQALISSMIHQDPDKRPNIDCCISHPMLWSNDIKVSFICEISDRLEDENQTILTRTPILQSVEHRAREVIGIHGWFSRLRPMLRSDAEDNRFRNYDAASLRDLFRFFRNKKAHHRDMDIKFQKILTIPDGFIDEFLSPDAFPRLLTVAYDIAIQHFSHEPAISRYIGDAAINHFKSQGLETTTSFSNVPSRSWLLSQDDWIDSIALAPTSSNSRPVPKSFKRAFCLHWEKSGGTRCPVGDKCGFAHNPFELRIYDFVDMSRMHGEVVNLDGLGQTLLDFMNSTSATTKSQTAQALQGTSPPEQPSAMNSPPGGPSANTNGTQQAHSPPSQGKKRFPNYTPINSRPFDNSRRTPNQTSESSTAVSWRRKAEAT